MEKTHITYIINKIDYGGAEIGMVRLFSELDTNKFDLAVITIKHVNPDLAAELPNNVTVHELNVNSGNGGRYLNKALESIRNSDILVCSLVPSILIGSIAGTIAQVPTIYSWRHTTCEQSLFKKSMYSISYWLSDCILVDSEASRQHIMEWGVESDKTIKLPLSGVEIDNYPAPLYQSQNEQIRIGTVGRLVEKKGYDELIQCAKQLPELEFHIIGGGPLKKDLQNASDNVICHGNVSQEELHRLWGTFDTYFQPSRYEGLCITAIEAMAAGLPVVASDIDGLSESIIHNETGFLVEQGNIEGYCKRLRELANNPDKRESMGTAGRERVAEKYSSKALARKFTAEVA